MGPLGDGGPWRLPVRSSPALPVALPDDLRSPIRAEREEPRNLHFFPPEYGGESRRARLLPAPRIRPAGPDSFSLFAEVADGTAVDIFSFGMCALEVVAPLPLPASSPPPSRLCCPSPCVTWPCPQMAVLEIQANGDTRVTEEAIARARHSLSDPNMRVSSSPRPFQLGGGALWQACKCSPQCCRGVCQPTAQGPADKEGLTGRACQAPGLKALKGTC